MANTKSFAASLQISRLIDLNDEAGRAQLIEACLTADSLFDARTALKAYLAYFPNPGWRKVYSGGMVGIGKSVHHIGNLLETATILVRLSSYRGFPALIHGLTNPSQVRGTLFEIETAWWSVTRKLTTGLRFAPPVTTKAGIKRPEFRWDTSVGRLYCECKEANDFENRAAAFTLKLADVLSNAYDGAGPWDTQLRLDLQIIGRAENGIERRIAIVVQRLAASGAVALPVREGEVEGILRKREEPLPPAPGTSRVARISVSATEPVKLLDENGVVAHESATSTLTRPMAVERIRKVRDLIREARRQLPHTVPGAVFINVIASAEAVQKAQQILSQQALANLFMIAFCSGRVVERIVWCQEGPFDAGLFEAADG